ncbi:MAG: hydroxyacid dehydrogenase [Armatimonadota bacterium]
MTRAMMLLPKRSRDQIYDADTLAEIGKLVDLVDATDRVGKLDALRADLAQTEVILSGWGMMKLNKEFLEAAPRLKAVLYGAGSVRGFLTEDFWQRDILLTSTYRANGIPVAEYTIAAIVIGTKEALRISRETCQARRFTEPEGARGLYKAKIGVIGAGMVGSDVLNRLKSYDVETFCYDPFMKPERARELGTTQMGLDEIFRTCDCVTLHAANIPATKGMITGAHLRSMKEGAVFINTARGAIVREHEMVEVLKEGRIFAFIDVTDPEPPAAESALYTLPNVFLTPHIAGAVGMDIYRQGEFVLEELRRFLKGEPAWYPVTHEMMEWMA